MSRAARLANTEHTNTEQGMTLIELVAVLAIFSMVEKITK